HKTRTTEVNTTRFWSTIRSHVNTEFTLRRFNRVINLTGRHIKTLRDDQEVMNERIHVTLHRLAIRKHNFWRVGFNWTRLQSRECLRRNLVRLLHLTHAHHVTCPNVAVRFSRNFEVVILITAIRICATDVESDAAAAQTRTGESPIDSIFRGNFSDALCATLKNLVAAEEG